MSFKLFFALAALAASVLVAPSARSQQIFISGEAGVALLGPPLVPLDQGVVGLTTRVGVGAEFDNFLLDFDVGAITPTEFGDGGLLVVPSIDAAFVFRAPIAAVRPYLGGGLDLVTVLTGDGGFALPWAHLTGGVDMRLNSSASVYVEARTYGLETQFSLGSKFRF